MRPLLLGLLAAASPAVAQPTLVLLGMGAQDISADGRTVGGMYYNALTNQYDIVIVTPDGPVSLTTAHPIGGSVRVSSDARVLSYQGGNDEALNNALNSIAYDPVPANSWERVGLSCTWSASTGRVNQGVHPNGNRCDSTINSPLDLSDDGRYIVGGMWTATSCGPFRAFIADSLTGVITQLPFSFEGPPANTFADSNAATAVNSDGSVVTGYDNNNRPTGGRVRRPCVWRRNPASGTWTQTVLDRSGGAATVVSNDGNVVGGRDSNGDMCRWRFASGSWTKEVCAGGTGLTPTAISADGSVMVGDIFIWSPNINDGVATPLADHAASLGGSFPDITFATALGTTVWAISDDGSKVLLRTLDSHNPCQLSGSAAILDLNGGPCVAPSVIFPPASTTSFVPDALLHPWGVILNVFYSGSFPMTYRWQKLDDLGEWTDLSDDSQCASNDPNLYDVRGADTNQLLLGFQSNSWRGRFRCVLTNACGVAISEPARVVDCPADYDTNGGVDGDDVIAYFADWDQSRDEADFDNNGGVDGDDIIAFFARWDQSC